MSSNRWLGFRVVSIVLIACSDVDGRFETTERVTTVEEASVVTSVTSPVSGDSEEIGRLAAERVDQLRSRAGANGVVLAPIQAGGAWFGLTTPGGPNPPDLWRFNGRGWDGMNHLLRADLMSVDGFETLDIDTDGVSEVLVTMNLNGVQGSLLRFERGAWTQIAWAENLTFSESEGLTGTWNDCEPSCAEGTVRRFRWIWEDDGLRAVDLP